MEKDGTSIEKLFRNNGEAVEQFFKSYGKAVDKLWINKHCKRIEKVLEKSWGSGVTIVGKAMERGRGSVAIVLGNEWTSCGKVLGKWWRSCGQMMENMRERN